MRPILLSEHPADGTHSVYVNGQVVTTLRFEQPVDPSKTKMLGWEGWLEPLAVVRYLKPHVGDASLAELDANPMKSRRITLYDGPIESVLMRDLGPLETTTRLYGRVWTSGPQVVPT